VEDVDVVVTQNNEYPTRENSEPVHDGEGRGSCVWFNQASMFQTAELGYNTVAEAKKNGLDGVCDAQEFIDKGLFPQPK
jgi:hypothetical protein